MQNKQVDNTQELIYDNKYKKDITLFEKVLPYSKRLVPIEYS